MKTSHLQYAYNKICADQLMLSIFYSINCFTAYSPSLIFNSSHCVIILIFVIIINHLYVYSTFTGGKLSGSVWSCRNSFKGFTRSYCFKEIHISTDTCWPQYVFHGSGSFNTVCMDCQGSSLFSQHYMRFVAILII